MAERKIKLRHIVYAVIAVIAIKIAYDMAWHYYVRSPYNKPTGTYIDKRGEDREIMRFAKKNIAYYTGGMDSGTGWKDQKKYEGDDFSKIYFEAKTKEDGSIWLVNIWNDPASFRYQGNGNIMTVRLDASTLYQDGKRLKYMYETAMNGGYFYSVREGSLYGLDKYVKYMNDGRKPSPYTDYLVAMKNETMPLRLLRVVTPRPVEGDAGGVYHHFMYNDLMQVKMHYRKIFLKDWQRIENAMRQYIDNLYAEANNETISNHH